MPNAQVLNLTPGNELSFEGESSFIHSLFIRRRSSGPFTEVVTTQLTLGNPTEDVVYFKVKTTAPRYYCVRPNSGIIGARGSAKISVMLQPVDQPSTLEKDRTRHKFMIQSAIASNEDTPVDEFWKTVNPSDVMDSKLKVVFTNLGSAENGGGGAQSDAHSPDVTRYADTHSTQQQQPKEPPPAYKPQESAQPVQRRNVEPQRTAPPSKVEHRSGSGDRNSPNEENFALVQQVQELRHKLNAATRLSNVQTTGISLVQLILAAVAALLIGVIVGKLL
ncbi:Major sperm protein [Aphelenchoides fujianensis]|nr:Major sperm protein [Aphelenchoides fujianensis]